MSHRILVTGGGGFIGSHLAKRLYDEGNFVRVVDMRWNGYMEEPYYNQKITADLRLKGPCELAVRGMDEVYHLAANMGGVGYMTHNDATVLHDNLLMDVQMFDAALKSTVERFLFTSSACVYPTYLQQKSNINGLRESAVDNPAAPDLGYGWEKLTMEKLCNAYHEAYLFNTRIARLHNIYGPRGTYFGGREKAPAAICRKVAEAFDHTNIIIWGDGKQTRSFCYVDDAVDGIMKLMRSDYHEGVNIGTDELVTINRLAEIAINASGKCLVIEHDVSGPVGVMGRNADISLAKKLLDWSPKVSLEEGIARTYKWIEKQHWIGQ